MEHYRNTCLLSCCMYGLVQHQACYFVSRIWVTQSDIPRPRICEDTGEEIWFLWLDGDFASGIASEMVVPAAIISSSSSNLGIGENDTGDWAILLCSSVNK